MNFRRSSRNCAARIASRPTHLEYLESRILLDGVVHLPAVAAPVLLPLPGFFLNTTLNGAGPIIAPGGLTATASLNAVALQWADLSNDETGYQILRSTDGSTFSQIASIARNSTTYTDSAVAPGTTYYYQVAAFNQFMNVCSNTAMATIPLTTAPAAPANLTVSSVTTSTVSLSWADAATTESAYRVYRSPDGTAFSLLASLPANSTSFTDSGLSPGTQYYYCVGAWNSIGEADSLAVNATTTTSAPPLPVTVNIIAMVGFNALRIDGTTGNDSILVTQSGNTLTVTAGGVSASYTGPFGNLILHGGSGNDTLTVDSSVNIPALVYADAGSDVIRNFTSAKATIVTIGGGNCTVTGNGINTAYWVNTSDTVNATTAETNLGGVNRVASFYQPWSTNPSNVDYIPLTLNGQNFRDPTDSGTETRLPANSFWGTGPTMNDINQTALSDCYFLAPLSSLAMSEPQRLMNMAVDLGDGTYAVRFVRNTVTSYVRVDGDLPAGGWAYGLANQVPGANGNLWGSIFEKAYAFFRSGASTYASVNFGYQATTLSDLGIANNQYFAASGDSTIFNLITTQINAGHAMASNTDGSISGGAPLISSHVYAIIGAYRDTSGTTWIRLRNPWGVDGAGNDGLNDGLITITYSQFAANFGAIAYATM